MTPQQRQLWSWIGYDWANSAYATVVMAGFFPIFFKNYWSSGVEATTSTFYLGLANFGASLVILLFAPLLGVMADRLSQRKQYLIRFGLLGVVATALLPLVPEGGWVAAALLYLLASVGFSGSGSFYDALLPWVAPQAERDRVSSLGYAFGYLGGGLLFALCVVMSLQPALFGLTDAAAAVRLSFVLVAGWWSLFTLPLILWVEEPPMGEPAPPLGQLWRESWQRVGQTVRQIRQQRAVGLFLLAYWCYIDGVDTVIRMAVDYGLALGFESAVLIQALLLTQLIGFPAAWLLGWIGGRFGTRRTLLATIGGYGVIVIWGSQMTEVSEFYALAAAIGLIQGGIQALSRSLYSRLIPPEQSGAFFGFYNLFGKFATLFGPLLMGVVSLLSDDPRLSILSLLPLFLLGGWLLLKVPLTADGAAAAAAVTRP